MTTVTSFSLGKNESGTIDFWIDERDIESGWYGAEAFHPSVDELRELLQELVQFLEELNANRDQR